MNSNFKNSIRLSFSLVAISALSACGSGSGTPASNLAAGSVNQNIGANQYYPNASGTNTSIPPLNFTCGPNCIQSSHHWYGRNVKTLAGKQLIVAILPATVQDCYQWRSHPQELELAVQKTKVRSCFGATCSTVVSSAFSSWKRPTGEKIRALPAGQYLVCATIDTNKNGYGDEDEFFSQTRIQIVQQTQNYYPQQTGTVYPGQQPINTYLPPQTDIYAGQPIPLTPASTYWDGSAPYNY